MKIVMALLLGLGFASNVFAEQQNSNDLALETVLIRQVLTQNLLEEKQASYNENLTRAIEGSGDSGLSDQIRSVSCDVALGTVRCELQMFTEAQDGKVVDEYKLEVRLFQGNATSASIIK